jgi:RNA polymerase sigma-70 factor (ECF subfamily)
MMQSLNEKSPMLNKDEKFKATVEENRETLLRICRYYAPSAEDQKDIYQEILINIWRSFDTFRGDSSIKTWIYRIALNTSLSYAGKQYRRMKLNVMKDTQNLGVLLGDEHDQKIEKEEQLKCLQTRLNELAVIDKAIMGLVLESLSIKEIADIIGLTEPNIRVKIHRIKEYLRKQMKGGMK